MRASMSACGDDVSGARHLDVDHVAGIDAEQIVGASSLQHFARRHRSGGADIGRAEYGNACERAGIVDEVADAHEIAGDDDAALEHRRRRQRNQRHVAARQRAGCVFRPGLSSGDLGSGDLGSGDLGGGDLGSGDLGSGDLGSGDLGSGDLGSGRRRDRDREQDCSNEQAPHHRPPTAAALTTDDSISSEAVITLEFIS